MFGGYLSKSQIDNFMVDIKEAHGPIDLIAITLVFITSLIIVIALSAFIIQWTWNNSIPFISKGFLPDINLKHAFALMILTSTLFNTKST